MAITQPFYTTCGTSLNLFFICGEAATATLGLKGRQTYEPFGQRPVNLKNPHIKEVSMNTLLLQPLR